MTAISAERVSPIGLAGTAWSPRSHACLPDVLVGGAAAGLHLVVHLPPGLSEEDAVARGRTLGLALEGLGNYRLGAQSHPPALVLGYGTPPEHAFSGAVTRVCAVFTS